MSDERAHWFTAPILDPVALRAELDEVKRENRWLRGNCDADTEGVHTIITEGRYKFCAKCGETITPDKLRMAEVFAERDALKAENERLREENADLKSSVVAFCGPWSVEWAKMHGLPPGHICDTHYDILERAGARLVDFVRVDFSGGDATTKTDDNGAAPLP